MKTLSRLLAALRQRRSSVKAQPFLPTAKRRLQAMPRQITRVLRLSRAQIRGGHNIIKRGDVYFVPLWLPIAVGILLASHVLWDDIGRAALRFSSAAIHLIRAPGNADLADFFSPSVQYWSDNIGQWAAQYEVDRHLLATVMQIESCGHPTVVSSAGAQGLFQVMPFHFAEGESMLDPESNAKRGASFLNYCYGASDGVIGLTLACYNGGPSVINQASESWSFETQNYYRWGVGIYSDAIAGHARSETLDRWLAAGGDRLCASALNQLGSPAVTVTDS